MVLPIHLLYTPGQTNIATAYTTHQYVADLRKRLRAIFAFAQKNPENGAVGRKAYYDQKASQDEPQGGDEVWYFKFTQPKLKSLGINKPVRKLLPREKGPYEITDKTSHRNQVKPHKNPMGHRGDMEVPDRT